MLWDELIDSKGLNKSYGGRQGFMSVCKIMRIKIDIFFR
jgi:hypothetical protein